ncbi:dienelactone hydrolase family protein [Woodsholea maritima]|uniref:dienelactone hydrolase family protein n=1 Tax=Woodsholea maritima TaxID=240237 RepID=UPI000367D5A6|nr:dienelactone hydrolase family protein [Woodsholea maritima]
MSWTLSLLLILLGLVLVICLGVGLTLVRRMRGLHVQRRSLIDHRNWIAPHFRMHWPEGEGPFPVVILMHGCGGARQSMTNFAQILSAAGYGALIVDSLAPRGIGYEAALLKVCTGLQLWGRERVADLLAAMDWAKAQPRLDENRIALVGWSHGAWAILDGLCMSEAGLTPDGLKTLPDAPLAGVKGVFAFYPYSGFPALSRHFHWPKTLPIQAILIEGDSVTNETASNSVFKRQYKAGADIHWRMITGVTHGFDEPDHHPKSDLRHDPEMTKTVEAELLNFLKAKL